MFEIVISFQKSSILVSFCCSGNEAIELAKAFGSVEGYKFVNGVLNNLIRVQ